jgi:predicted acylesterase/phospholipase RssA
MIEHLVFSGSGPNGLIQLGILTEYEKQGLLQYDKIDKIYGASAGALIGLLCVFSIPISETVEYLVKRPWAKFTKIDFFDLNEKGGIIECEKVKELMQPLLMAYDVPLNVTFEDVKKHSNIDLHVFATNMESLDSIDFNVHTHPKMSVMTAIMHSCSVPPIFTVGMYEGIAYADGGMSDNFPLAALLQHPSKPDPSTVLCINMTGPLPMYKPNLSLIDLMTYIAQKSLLKITSFEYNHNMAKELCKHYVFCNSRSVISKELWEKFLYSEEDRKTLYEIGVEVAKEHLSSLKLDSEVERC